MSQSTSGGGSSSTIDVDAKGIRLPAKVIVSMRAGAVLAVANIICVAILSWAWVHSHREPKVISVTGSSRQTIESDRIVWRCKVFGSDPDLQKAYAILDNANTKVNDFLHAQHISDDAMSIRPISVRPINARTSDGKETNTVEKYELSQCIEITSGRVAEVEAASRAIGRLLKDGIYVISEQPEFIYTHMADLKIEMLAAATKDAATRANQIASNSGSELGAIIDAKMGVLQINAVNDYETSGGGVNDTSSRQKAITAVVTARFAIK